MLSLRWRRAARKTNPARITAAALMGTAATVAALVATDIVPVPSWALDGIDVASHQHPGGAAIDWNAVAASGQKFAFVKATEGTNYTNPFFSTDSIKAQSAGLMPGSYHYARPGDNDPRAEARFYATTLATGPQPSLPPVLDLEESGGLGPQQLQNWVRDFLNETQLLTGRQPIIYTYDSFWRSQMGNTTEFANYPLWLAYYNDSLPDDIPGGWSEVTFWQYTGSGNVDGVMTNVDMNKYYGTDASLQALAADLPSGTLAGDAANALEPLKRAAGGEAQLASQIEHITGVDVPLASDFLMVLLGVAGGRLPAEALLTQGAAQIESAAKNGQNPMGSSGANMPEGASGSVTSAQEVLRAYKALSGALDEYNRGGKKLPVDMITNLLKGTGAQSLPIGQVLGMLQQFGGISNWNAKLENGEIAADPNALQELSDTTTHVDPQHGEVPIPEIPGMPAPAAQ